MKSLFIAEPNKEISPYSYSKDTFGAGFGKKEQHPQNTKLFHTVTPDGKSMDNWMSGGWNTFTNKNC
jgi:hypothetical protein